MKLITYIIPLLLLAVGSRGQAVRKMSLSEALSLAATANRQVQIQTLEEARQQSVTREVRSQLLPSVNAGAGYQHYFDRQVIFLPGYFAGTTKPVQDVAVGGKNAVNGLISASQPLLNETARRQTKAALYDERIQQEKSAELQSALGEQISITYLDMLFMQSQIGLQRQSLARNEKALADTRSLYAQGRSLKADTLRAFISVENLRSSISYLDNQVEVTGIRLKRLIGLDEADVIALTDNLGISGEDAGASELAQAQATAAQSRNDIAIRKLTVEKSQVALAVAKSERIPKVMAIGQYQLQAQADNVKLGQYVWPRTSFIGVQVAVPVFNGNRVKSQISQAAIRAKQESIGLDDLHRSVKAEIAALVSQRQEAVRQLAIQQRTVELAEVSYAMMDERYRNGLGTRLELTDAELALTQSKINYLQAIYRHKVVQVQLRRAQGLLQLQ
ncbi:TolC family protein [Chitinophaga caseinilytica]|uniref:TolC family protein n=1 Tax=Chitinophaga caseinilytica TaxID=2267521 RepID=A0ABZ2YZP8_9BACT